VSVAEHQFQFITDEEGEQKHIENECVTLAEDKVRFRHRTFDRFNRSATVSRYSSYQDFAKISAMVWS